MLEKKSLRSLSPGDRNRETPRVISKDYSNDGLEPAASIHYPFFTIRLAVDS